jgi:hypothetical protein
LIVLQIQVIPDRVVMARSTVKLDETLPVGKAFTVTVLPNDRRGRPSATDSTKCIYNLEYFEVLRGTCSYNEKTRDLSFVVHPNATGTYFVTVYIDNFLMRDHPVKFTVSTSVQNYDPSKSSASGSGLSVAGAGQNNTFFLFLRDLYGNVIPPEYHTPLLGYPFWRECGYNYAMLQDGTPTAGYGNPGTWRWSLSHGCRVGLHVYIPDWNGLPIRPARGFQVLEIRPQPEGSVKFVYTIQEAGLHALYFRYLNSDQGGYILHNESGHLSLDSMNRSREGQIHGSPFQLRVVPGVSSIQRTRIVGPGIIGGDVDSKEWARFDVATYDSFSNQVRCSPSDVRASVFDVNGHQLDHIVRIGSEDSQYDHECHVFYRPKTPGVHTVNVVFQDAKALGSPFNPSLARGSQGIANWNTRARLESFNTKFPCFLDKSQQPKDRCRATSQAGSSFAVRVSARDPNGLLPSDESSKFTVHVTEKNTGRRSFFKTHRIFQGEHKLETTLTASGVYSISVTMALKSILFSPWSIVTTQLVIFPAATHPAACTVAGQGLSIATSGTLSSFSIIPRDIFGNRQIPSPSPDSERNAPGAGIFQVRVRGPMNTVAFAAVSERPDGTFTASFDVTWVGQYSIWISMLDEAPKTFISSAAVVRKAFFRSALDGTVGIDPGRLVSTVKQPVVLHVEPNSPSTGSPCSQACCDKASFMRHIDLGSGPAVAGEPFKVGLYLVDICGNPTVGTSENASIVVYGPLDRTTERNFRETPLNPGFNPLISRSNAMSELLDWQETLYLTVSGAYGIAVSLNGELVHEGSSIVHVLPVHFTATEKCVLDRNISVEPVSAAAFDFFISSRDPYGNERVSPDESFELALYPISGRFDGVLKMNSDVKYVSGGTYHAHMSALGTFGEHILTIRHEGRHVHGSPFKIQVIGGYMDADNSDVVFNRVSQSQDIRVSERVISLGIDDDLKIQIQGRDSNGALTRLGLDSISFSVVHESRGDITPSLAELDLSRSQTICTETKYGKFCKEPPRGPAPLFSYEVQVDASNIADFIFKHHQRAKCRSLSGQDDEETVFHNTKEVKTPVQIQILGGPHGNQTMNITVIKVEFHPTSYYNLSQCEATCAEFNCTCATSIENTGTYLDGTCIALGKAFFLREYAQLESPGNTTVAIVTERVKFKAWELQQYEKPLTFIAKSRLSGNVKVYIRIGGQEFRVNPVSLSYSPGLLGVDQSTIVVRNNQLEVVCLKFGQTNCITPAAGENYTISLTPRDREGNALLGVLPESLFRVKIRQAGQEFVGMSKKEGTDSLVFTFTPTQSGPFDLSVQQETTYGTVMQPFSTSALNFSLTSSSNVIDGQSISFDRSACLAKCIVSATVPNDPFRNPFDASYTLLILDSGIGAYVTSGFLSGLTPVTTSSATSTFALSFTRSGQYLVIATSIHGPQIPGSPLTISVTPADHSTVSVSGPGTAEMTIFETTFADINFLDTYGNPLPCDRTALTMILEKEDGKVINITSNTTNGNAVDNHCRSMYAVTRWGTYSLEVKMQGKVVASANVSTARYPGTVPFQGTSPAECYVISPILSSLKATACSKKRTKASISDKLWIKIQERTEGGGLVGSKATLIAIEGDNATLPEVVNHPNYTQPHYPWTAELEQCDQLPFLATEGQLCSPIGDIYNFPFTSSNTTLGDLFFSHPLEVTGIFKVFYRLPRSKEFGMDFGYLGEPWFVQVQAMETDLSQVELFGSGLDLAIYNEQGSFVLEDRDKFGNLRGGNELVTSESLATFLFDFSFSITSAQTKVQVTVKPDAQCLDIQCLLSGRYNVLYKAQLPSTCSLQEYLSCPDALSPAKVDIKVLYKKSSILSRPIDLMLKKINYVPATARIVGFNGQTPGQTPRLKAGLSYSLQVQPQDLYGNPTLPSLEQFRVKIEKGNPNITVALSDSGDSFAITLKATFSGTYRISVFDGELEIRGSPYSINVLPGPPNPQSCVLQGSQAFVTNVDVHNVISANLVDSFGNIVTDSQDALVTAFFSTVESNTSLLQIPGVRNGAFENIQYAITRPGQYRIRVKVGNLVVEQGKVIVGGVIKPLGSDGTTVQVLSRGTCSDQCRAFGQGLTLMTAGGVSSFFIVAKDEFGIMHRQQGEYFGITVDGKVDKRCSVKTDEGYPGTCAFTKSGTYRIALTFAGDYIGDKQELVLNVLPEATYPLACYLEQSSPKVHMQMIDGTVHYATTDLEDGAFVGQVGSNAYRLVLNDKFGNQLRYPVRNIPRKQKNTVSAVQSVSRNSTNMTALHQLVNLNEEDMSDTAEHDIRFWIKPLFVSYTGGFLMWEPDADVVLTNSSAPKKDEEDGLDEYGNPIQPVILNTTDEILPVTDIPDQPQFNKTVMKNVDGTYSLSFMTTAAGKYRLEVYIDGFLIRRYIPLIEIEQQQAGVIKSHLDCCVPWDDLRKIPKKDGLCPSAASGGNVCGDLITLLPLDIDVTNSFIVGNSTKQFKALEGGDGEGNKANPVFEVATVDVYGNSITTANVEVRINIYDINGTIVLTEPVPSIQPKAMEFVCRTVPPQRECGRFRYEWTGLSASRSGKYLIDVTYNGLSIGMDRITTHIRSVEPSFRESQLWGPGLQISVAGEMTYFYFRVKDRIGNDFDPDSIDSKDVQVDFGGTAEFYGVSYPGEEPISKLKLDSKSLNPRTKLIYHGYSLFQVQYVPWPNATDERGSVRILHGEAQLVQPGAENLPTPLILGSAGYDALKPADVQLVPNAYTSFATGSGLYNHFAGDEVEVTVHALSNYKTFGGGYWPATTDVDGKYFVVLVQGPPGVPSRQFVPKRGTAHVSWQFQSKWIPSVSGMYTISILYDGTHVQGDSSTDVIALPKSPYHVQVYQAPVQPSYSVLSGAGLTAAFVGDISTFRVSTRDIFNNSITAETFYAYKGDEFVNASLIATKGPSLHARTISLRDGSYRCEYQITKSGQYSLVVMVNGVLVSNPPLIVHATSFPDFRFTRWFIQRAGLEAEMCTYSHSAALLDVDGNYLNPGCISGLLFAGDMLEGVVLLRDGMNNSIDAPLTLEDVDIELRVEGNQIVERAALPVGPSTFSAGVAITKAGMYSFSVLMGRSVLRGSPFAVNVSASVLYVPACFTTGDGLQSSLLNRTRGLVIHGRDVYGNNQTLMKEVLDFDVYNAIDERVKSSTSIQLGILAKLQYRIEVPGDYQVVVRILDYDKTLQKVPGSDVVVTAFRLPPPKIVTTYFARYLDSILMRFDSPTDMACMQGEAHEACLKESSTYEDCCFLFQDSTCSALGLVDQKRRARCTWQSPYEMKIVLGKGATILPRDFLQLHGVIRNRMGTSEYVKGSVQVDPPSSPLYPLLDAMYFPSASTCQDVFIDVSKSQGSGGRPFSFEWSVGPQIQPLHDRLKALPSTLDAVKFGNDLLDSGTTEITVRLRNYLNFSTSSVLDIKKTTDTPLRVMIEEGTTIQTFSTVPLTLTGQVEASICTTVSALELRWSQVKDGGDQKAPDLNLGNLTVSNQVLYFAPFTLAPGNSYIFSFKAVALISGQSRSAETQVTIHVARSPLTASISGPYGYVAEDSLLLWDASSSFDPDLGDSLRSVGYLEYSWSCNPIIAVEDSFRWKAAKVSTKACFYDFTGILLKNQPLLNLTGVLPHVFMCNECLPGMFRINVNVTRTVLGAVRWAVASSVVSISGSSMKDALAGIIPLPYRKISPSQRLYLDGFEIVRLQSTAINSKLQYEWTLFNQEGCCLGSLNMSRDQETIFPGGNRQPFLIIKREILTQGLEYVFQLTVKNLKNETSSSFVHIQVDQGPRGGNFVVSPTRGTMTTTKFLLECSNWVDEVEDYPLEYDFEYSFAGDYSLPIDSSPVSRAEYVFPDVSQVETTLLLYVRIRDIHGTTHNEESSVLVTPSAINSLAQVTAFAENKLGLDLERDINSTDMKNTMERILSVVSVMNRFSALHQNTTSRRRGNELTFGSRNRDMDRRFTKNLRRSFEMQFNVFRSKILNALELLTVKTTHTRFTVRALSVAMNLNTLYPNQLLVPEFDKILIICQKLMLQRALYVENVNASVPFAGILRNLLEASRQYANSNSTRLNLRKDELIVGEVMMIKNILSQAILEERLPDEEFVPLQTSAFIINSRRVRSETAKGLIMGANTLLESQSGIVLKGSSSYSITNDAIDFRSRRYKIDDNSFFFGTHPYPMTVYDKTEAFPKSIFPSTYRGLDLKLFQQSPPMTQKDKLTLFYLDFEITQWKFSPFETGERRRTELDWASIQYGRSIARTCSSVFVDCSNTNHVCTPPVVEGSQGPEYTDTACDNAFDGDDSTSWAVDPKQIYDETGAGSTVTVNFVTQFLMTMVKYKPRIGPKYCAGSAGVPCTISAGNCTCIIGGDRLVSFTFSDGSVQTVELARETYDTQMFDLKPVLTHSVTMKVLSVYSNSRLCPDRKVCAWWQPTCVDWCPNGAASIEFLTTEAILSAYDYNYSYMTNYSVVAARVSDVTSMEMRQHDHVMHLFGMETPFQLNMSVQSQRRSVFPINDQMMVVCRSWDDRIGRWSSRGTLVAGLVEDLHASSPKSGLTSCIIFLVANFSLVLVEKPYDSIPTLYGEYGDVWKLNESEPDSLVCAAGIAWIFVCYLILVLLRFKGWLRIWHQAEVRKRNRINEYLISLSNPALRGKPTDDLPVIQPFYYPIIGLANSRVIAAHAMSKKLFFRILLYGSFARWHYLYAMITGHDDISRFARITSFFCLVMFSFALNACTLSGATINGQQSLLQTEDIDPSQWWYESIKSLMVIFPIAQVLPAFFRLVSMRHEDFDRWEVSDVQIGRVKVQSKEVFGPEGLEKRSDLKTLRFKIGSTAIFDLLNPVIQENRNAPPKKSRQKISFTELVEDETKVGSLKHFVRSIANGQSVQPSSAENERKESSLSLSLSMSVSTGNTTTVSDSMGTLGSTTSTKQEISTDQTTMPSNDVHLIRGGASLTATNGNRDMKSTVRQCATLLSNKATGRLSTVDNASFPKKTVKGQERPTDDEDAVETIDLDTQHEFTPHPPTPRDEDPPPVAPLGIPARQLTYHQEKSLLRKRWMKQRNSEAIHFASPVRRALFFMLCGNGYNVWNRGQRPLELLFFPRYFINVVYAICFFWLLICYMTSLIYTTAFDRDMAWSWAYASMTTLFFECCVSQTLLSLACCWWKHIDGRVTLHKAIIKWCLFRTDLMPPMG